MKKANKEALPVLTQKNREYIILLWQNGFSKDAIQNILPYDNIVIREWFERIDLTQYPRIRDKANKPATAKNKKKNKKWSTE